MASSASLEVVNQLENGSIHSSDVQGAQLDAPTGELRSRRKRKIKVSEGHNYYRATVGTLKLQFVYS